VIGLVGGGVIGTVLPNREPRARPPTPSAGPSLGVPASSSLRLEMPAWLTTVRPAFLVAPPPAGHGREPVMLMGVEGTM